MGYFSALLAKAIAAAGTLTGKKFGLLVASSVVATSAVVASAMTNPEGGISPLAALLGQSLAAEQPAEVEPPEEEAFEGSTSDPSSSPSPAPVASSSPEPEAAPEPAPEPAEEEPTDEPASQPAIEAGPIQHVFVISLTSPGYDSTFGESATAMPYLNTELVPQGELLSNYSLLDEKPSANAIATISGQKPTADSKQDCPKFDDCVLPVETYTVADQLTVGQKSWGAYVDGMIDPATGKPGNCVYPGADEPYPPAEGGYTATRNPFVFFHSLLDLGDCSANDKPLTALEADLKKKEATPNFSYIVPTLCESGSTAECPAGQTGGPAAADAFLSEWVPKILKSAAYEEDGLLVVTFDQVDQTGATPPVVAATGKDALKTGTLLVSRFLAPGSTDAKPYDPYSLLASSEEMFGFDKMATAGAKTTKSFLSALMATGNGGD